MNGGKVKTLVLARYSCGCKKVFSQAAPLKFCLDHPGARLLEEEEAVKKVGTNFTVTKNEHGQRRLDMKPGSPEEALANLLMTQHCHFTVEKLERAGALSSYERKTLDDALNVYLGFLFSILERAQEKAFKNEGMNEQPKSEDGEKPS